MERKVMNREQHEKILSNRAEVNRTERIHCENCFEEIIFALKDSRGNEFSLGLSTVLECLKHSERERVIPPIPYDWWLKIYNYCYKGDFL